MKIFSVGQVNNYIKNLITQDYLLKNIAIRGEVSNCKYHSLGHIYFSLKDETGTIPVVMFKNNVSSGLNFRMSDGQAVVVSGYVGVYERDGRYQLYATKVTLDGAGRLYEEFERLKQRLNEEGLFDCDLKKEIPRYPKKVGIVTAKTGAAIQDIINIARRRNPYVQLILYPAKVQGEGASDTIVKGIETLDTMDVDTIIVGRGGGSIEDLWAFNEEKVVRAIYNASTPIISGTGHEIDITLADYAADRRAPTPSAACELAIPDVMSIIASLDSTLSVLRGMMNTKYAMAKLKLDSFDTKLQSLNPKSVLEQKMQYLADMYDKMRFNVEKKLDGAKHRLEVLTVALDGLSPTAKLINGFGYIDKDDVPVTGIDMVSVGDEVNITIHDGTIKTKVIDVCLDNNC